MKKYTLAIETSCDDTSISILQGIEVISIKTFSQIKEHKKYGGVIPEIASRLHSKHIFMIIEDAIEDSGITLKDIDRIAVTGGPGLVNTLQVGITVAKSLSLSLKVPLYDINHIEAHAYSPFIGKDYKKIPNKAITVIASGGHTQILLKDKWEHKLIGETKDDSIGEAYDKVAKILGYSYPGGPIIDEIHRTTSQKPIECPVSKLNGYAMSYSGLKSHVLKLSKERKPNKEAIAKGFQIAAVDQLVLKIKKAVEEFKTPNIIIGGGVSANSYLRKELEKIPEANVFLPKMKYTGDNAAMIGYLGVIKILSKQITPATLKMDAEPRRKI